MDEKKFVGFKKEELGIKEYVKKSLGKGKISNVSMEYTPVGEKIVIATSKPGLVIGRKGEKIEELTRVLKIRFHLDNPHIEIREVNNPNLDAQIVADEIALVLERDGPLRFKIVAYRSIDSVMKTGALGVEIVLSGRLPSERAKTWRFAQGYLKKTGEPAKVVEKGKAQAITTAGIVGIEVSILPPNAHIHDRIIIDEAVLNQIKGLPKEKEEVETSDKKKKTVKRKKQGGNE